MCKCEIWYGEIINLYTSFVCRTKYTMVQIFEVMSRSESCTWKMKVIL